MEVANNAKKAHKVIIDEDGKRKYFYGPQKYRKQWQDIPELRAWCRASPRSNTEAFCTFCERHLKANRKSLLNHAQSKHHLESLPGKPQKRGRPKGRLSHGRFSMEPAIIPDDNPLYDEDQAEDGEIYDDGSMPGTSFVQDEDSGDMSFMVTEVDPPHMGSDEDDDEGEYEENGTSFSVPPHIANGSSSFSNHTSNHAQHYHRPSKAMAKSPITTHVLDTMHGCPAGSIAVSLFRLQDEEWTLLATDLTNDDGRCNKLIVPAYFVAGRYKLHFFVEEYFKKLNIDYFFPFVEIVFDVKDANEHYHVPILLNAFGFTTYRGS